MKKTLAITAAQRSVLHALLSGYLPGVEVWAFGSRVDGTARDTSDLDLAAFASAGDNARIAELREALEESSLPFRVDLHVWSELPESFRKTIEANHIVLQGTEASQEGIGYAG